mmetsp:Transcript_32400/g.71274  ORF Transcript_32400/g.71274 Transcript_32400/m.71274 type:complete len:293 (+) Transcript_32400:1588-2466(+)
MCGGRVRSLRSGDPQHLPSAGGVRVHSGAHPVRARPALLHKDRPAAGHVHAARLRRAAGEQLQGLRLCARVRQGAHDPQTGRLVPDGVQSHRVVQPHLLEHVQERRGGGAVDDLCPALLHHRGPHERVRNHEVRNHEVRIQGTVAHRGRQHALRQAELPAARAEIGLPRPGSHPPHSQDQHDNRIGLLGVRARLSVRFQRLSAVSGHRPGAGRGVGGISDLAAAARMLQAGRPAARQGRERHQALRHQRDDNAGPLPPPAPTRVQTAARGACSLLQPEQVRGQHVHLRARGG